VQQAIGGMIYNSTRNPHTTPLVNHYLLQIFTRDTYRVDYSEQDGPRPTKI